MTRLLNAVHPGEVLDEEFLQPLGLSQYKLSQEMEVSARRINEIVLRKRSITADTAVRLARFFGTSEMFWMNLQARFELDRLAERKALTSAPPVGSSRRSLPRRTAAGSGSIHAAAVRRSANARHPRKVK